MSRSDLEESELVVKLQAVAEELGHAPTTREWQDATPHGASVFYKYFDSWADALRKSGLDPTKRSLVNQYSIPIRVNNYGHVEITHRHRPSNNRWSLLIHRLHATLLVDDISELDEKIEHHVNGCPFDNRLENYEIISEAEHRHRHGSEWGSDRYTVLCRDCGTPGIVSTPDVEYCSYCGSILDCKEIVRKSSIDWGSSLRGSL